MSCLSMILRSFKKLSQILLTLVVLVFFQPVFAADTTIISWNMGAPDPEELQKRHTQLKEAHDIMGGNIYILQELTHFSQAVEFAEAIGMEDAHIVVSNFGIYDSEKYKFNALEMAVVSDKPILEVYEYDGWNNNTTFDKGAYVFNPNTGEITISNFEKVTYPDLTGREDEEGLADANTPRVDRGFLRVELENNLVLYPVHMKSNRIGLCGDVSTAAYEAQEFLVANESKMYFPVDHEVIKSLNNIIDETKKLFLDQATMATTLQQQVRQNARKREHLIAKLVEVIKNDDLEVSTVVVAGDFNAPWKEECVTGEDMAEDTLPDVLCGVDDYLRMNDDQSPVALLTCDGKDGFDDSHAMLMGGYDSEINLTALTENLNERTYISEHYVDSPIDHIYVGGKLEEKFTDASIPPEAKEIYQELLEDGKDDIKVWGTDHYPIITVLSE